MSLRGRSLKQSPRRLKARLLRRFAPRSDMITRNDDLSKKELFALLMTRLEWPNHVPIYYDFRTLTYQAIVD